MANLRFSVRGLSRGSFASSRPVVLAHQMRLAGRTWSVVFAAACVLGTAPRAGAQSVVQTELKAAIVASFPSFISWPATALAPDATVVLCVVNDPPLGEALERAVRRRTVGHHKLAVASPGPGAAVPACHVLYIGGSAKTKLSLDILAGPAGTHAFTIGDAPDFVTLGGMVKLFRRDDRLRFEVDVDAVHRAGLKLSSRVLALADVIRDARASISQSERDRPAGATASNAAPR